MKEEYLNKSKLILENLKSSINSFFVLYDSLEETEDYQKQDLLRAIILFSCSGIDAIVKQLINDTLHHVIEHDEGAFNQFKKYTEDKIVLKNSNGINSKLLSELFTCENPKVILINALKRDLTQGSLQSVEELFKVGSYFNIESTKLESDRSGIEELRNIFVARNQITHEMDVDMSSPTIVRRHRDNNDVKNYSDHLINLSEKFINIVSEKLDDTEEVNEFEQVVSI